MNVNTEGTNTHSMQQHAMRAVVKGALSHEEIDLMSTMIDSRQSTVLNAQESSSFEGPLISDADEQLIVKLVFKEKVTVTEVSFETPDDLVAGGGDDSLSRAKDVKIYANRGNVDFNDIEDVEPGMSVVLKDEEISRIVLNGAKFSRILDLVIFISSNFGQTLTAIKKLSVKGYLPANYHVEYKKAV